MDRLGRSRRFDRAKIKLADSTARPSSSGERIPKMSDPVRNPRDRNSPPLPAGPTTSFLRRIAGQLLDSKQPPGAADGTPAEITQRRIDRAHLAVPPAREEAAPPQTTAPTAVTGADSTLRKDLSGAAARGTPAAPFSRREEEVLRQTGQIAAHLRTERQDLERRESALHEQHALLDQEWRTARMWVQEFEEEMLKRQAECKAREEALNEKIGACESLVSDLEEQERLVLGLRDQMSSERSGLRSMVDRELEVERIAIQQTQQALDEERRALAEEIEKRRREREEMVRSLQAQLTNERNSQRAQLDTQAAAERAAFEAEKAAWDRRRSQEDEELSKRREVSQSASERAQEEMHAVRRREFDELRREREAFETQDLAARQSLSADREKLEADRRRFSDELGELKRIQIEEIERERAAVRDEIEASRRDLDSVRSRIEEDLKQRVDAREQNLREEQRKLEEQHREQLGRLEQERNLLENRLRFQQEHLQKARQEVEAAQNELRRQHQSDRTDLEAREAACRLRFEQVAHVRALIEEREQSLEREHSLKADQHQGRETDLASREEEFTRERDAWVELRQEREAELERRETAVAAESDRLDKRRERLEGLRTELEETHRATLEMRMAIEEVWAQFSEAAGGETAKRRLAETQRRLQDDTQQARDTVERERKELALLQSAIQAQRHELAKESQEAAVAAKERREEFDRRSRAIAENAGSMRTREEQVHALREQWITEKIEVERIIRGLLVQLGQQSVQDPAAEPAKPAATDASRAA
jgi:hypothetical protein